MAVSGQVRYETSNTSQWGIYHIRSRMLEMQSTSSLFIDNIGDGEADCTHCMNEDAHFMKMEQWVPLPQRKPSSSLSRCECHIPVQRAYNHHWDQYQGGWVKGKVLVSTDWWVHLRTCCIVYYIWIPNIMDDWSMCSLGSSCIRWGHLVHLTTCWTWKLN